jgi:hypothetical protein
MQPPRTILCHTISSGEQQTAPNGATFYRATFRLERNVKTWDRKVLNRGFKHFKTANDKTLVVATVEMTDENGVVKKVPTNEPVLLAADGTRLPDGQVGNFLSFRVKGEADFNTLGV